MPLVSFPKGSVTKGLEVFFRLDTRETVKEERSCGPLTVPETPAPGDLMPLTSTDIWTHVRIHTQRLAHTHMSINNKHLKRSYGLGSSSVICLFGMHEAL